ncbi:hypothetical protein [Dehalogenimonas sp. 4OHTPN]|uniref:Uncharacterized protein n=1 Tax=Dehalogenimonas sp. 4OHTPN TaxID=3166643 RepID=A0AAU8GC59_9CHLR
MSDKRFMKMNEGDLISKLEHLEFPEIDLNDQRIALRQVLIESHQAIGGGGQMKILPLRLIAIGSLIGIAGFMTAGLLGKPPITDSLLNADHIMAAVIEDATVKAALMGEGIAHVVITGSFEYSAEVIITTSSGRNFSLLIDENGHVVGMNPGTPYLGYGFFPLITSENYSTYYEEESPLALTQDEKGKVEEFAKTADPLLALLENGAKISRISIAYAKTTTLFDAEKKTWTILVHEKLAQVLVEINGQGFIYFIDFLHGELYLSIDDFCSQRGIVSPSQLSKIGSSVPSIIDLRGDS